MNEFRNWMNSQPQWIQTIYGFGLVFFVLVIVQVFRERRAIYSWFKVKRRERTELVEANRQAEARHLELQEQKRKKETEQQLRQQQRASFIQSLNTKEGKTAYLHSLDDRLKFPNDWLDLEALQAALDGASSLGIDLSKDFIDRLVPPLAHAHWMALDKYSVETASRAEGILKLLSTGWDTRRALEKCREFWRDEISNYAGSTYLDTGDDDSPRHLHDMAKVMRGTLAMIEKLLSKPQ